MVSLVCGANVFAHYIEFSLRRGVGTLSERAPGFREEPLLLESIFKVNLLA